MTVADDLVLTELDKQRFAKEIENGMVPLDDPLLSQTVKAVDPKQITGTEVQSIIARLHDVANGQRRTGVSKRHQRTLVGLAAPQIGENAAIVLIDTKVTETRKGRGKRECFVNPVIVWRSREAHEGREGCFSTGPIWGLVRRPIAVKIKAYDEQGSPVERVFEGFTARIAQHEIDHLSGIRFPDRITNDKKRHWVHTDELADYPEQIKHWPRQVTRAQWDALKSGARLPVLRQSGGFRQEVRPPQRGGQ